MIYNGEIPTVQAPIFTAPAFSKGSQITLIRVVNESAAARTFSVSINVNGTARAITPLLTQLPKGAAYDDFPVFQIPSNAVIEAVADDADVSWTINAE